MSIAKRIVMVVAMALVVGNVWGADKTTTWTATSGGLGSDIGSGTIYTTVSGTSAKQAWTYTRTLSSGSSYTGWTSNCIQLGKNGGVENLTLTTSNILGTIKSVSVECSSYTGSHEVAITVGGTSYLASTATASWTTVSAKSGTGTSSGTITISFTGGTRALYIKSISVTYTPPAYTVTFDAGGGTFDDPSSLETGNKLTESSSGAGIILPATSPSIACTYEEWSLYGWATTSCSSSTTTTPAIVGKAGDRYYPGSNETIYAVYAKGEFTKETSSITPGSKYLIVANSGGKNYIMKSSSADFREDGEGFYGMETAQINETSAGKYNIKDVDGTWCYTIEGTAGAYYIRDVVNSSSKNYADITISQWWGCSKYTSDTYTITASDGFWTIMNNDDDEGDYFYLGFYEEDAAFYTFDEGSDVLLYRETVPATYFSNPECCETAPVIGGTAQLKAGGTYSLTRVDVECTSATVQDNCEWKDYGFIWSESKNAVGTLVLNADGTMPDGVNKVQCGTSGDASSFNGSLEKSSFETGHTYYYRAYAKNCYYDGSYVYSNSLSLPSFTPYAVSYDNNGGTGSIAPQIVNTGGSITLSNGTGFAAPTGYHFDHWALNSTSGSSYDASDSYSSITADATFYAIWAINSHTLAWNFTGGSSSETAGTHYTAAGTKDYGTALSYPSSGSMSRTGYTFAGWSTDASTMPDNDLTITASWNTISYDVTYHPNGGSDVSDRTYTIETATFSLPTPSKTGYTFGGWYDNSSCTGVAVSSITVGSTGNREYWAKWTANTYTVVFNKNGGQGDNMSNQGFTYDAPAKALSRNEYTPAAGSHKYFAGWATSTSRASAGTVDYADQAEVRNLTSTANGTYNLYAVWKAHTYTNYRTTCITRYDITLDDGEVATTNNGSAQVSANGTKLAKMVAPTKTGYTLKGYYTAKSDGYKIADLEGVLQAGVSVSETEWTNSGGQWVKGGDATFYAQWDVNTYDITLNREGAEDGDESVTLTYNSNSHDAITNPSKVGYTFSGWYSGIGGTGTLVIDANGVLQNSVTIETVNWTDASGNWIKDGTATLYAKWTVIQTTLSFNQNSGEDGQTSNLTATYAATMPAISGTPTRAGYYFGGYYDGAGGTGTQYYTAAGASARSWDKDDASLTLYARWYGDLKAWCDPDNISITGDVHLTSYKDIYVNSTAEAGNLINFSCSELGSATAIEVAYLNADAADAEVAKESSLFRLCDGSDYSAADNINIAASRALDKDFSIKYQPSTFNQLDNYKLQLKLKNGDLVLKTITSDAILHGRALPEEFVIAVKNGDTWVALPNDLATTLGDQSDIAPTAIVVDNATTPTQADYAPANAVYKVIAKKNDGHRSSIRLTATGSNYLRGSSTADNSKLCLATNNYDDEDWYLKSSNLSVYEIAFDPTTEPAKKMGLYTKSTRTYMGYSSTQTNANIYLLPIETKYAVIEASPTEWSKNALAVTAEANEATQVEGRIEDGTPTSKVTLSSEGSDHTAEFSKDEVDFSGKEGQNLLLLWYNGSDELVGGSQITIPRIMSATGTEESWADFAVTPTVNDIVVLKKPITITGNAQAKRVVIDQSEGNTGKLVIEAGKSLVVAEKVIVNNGTTFVPTSENDLIISSSKTEGLGGLVMGNHDGTDKATVYFYTKSHGASGSRSSVSQYVGTPFGNSPVMVYQFYNSWMYKLGYNGSGDITGWTRVNGGEGLVAFDGYCVISADGEDHFYEMSGDLCSSENVEKELMYGTDNTENMLANSWMAPIRIREFDPENDFTNVEATIYIFNSGSPEDYVTNNGGSSSGSLAGQYSTYTIGTAGDAVIPAMQSFSVYATGPDPKITLNHKRLVYDPAVAGTASIIPNKAPQRISAKSEEMELLKLRVSSTSGWGDEVKIYTHEEFSEGFENGWDGRKMEGSSSAPQIYALSSEGNMAINCIPDLEGSQLGFKAGKTDDTYTLSFEYSENAEPLYLLDVTNNAYTRVLNNNSYTFTTRDKIDHTRFVLTHYFAPSITTGVDDTKHEGPKAHKLMIDGILYIIRDGRIYSAEGSLVK